MFSGSCNKRLCCLLSEDIQAVDIAGGVVICVFHRVFRVEVFKIPNGFTNLSQICDFKVFENGGSSVIFKLDFLDKI